MSEIIQVRNVPKDVHVELVRQAQAAGLSLNRFLLAELDAIARRGRNAEILRRAATRKGKRATTADVVKVFREMRSD